MLLIKNIDIYNYDSTFFKKDVLIDNNKIIKIEDKIYYDSCKIIDGSGKKLIPGFIDSHIHGSFDYDFMDANVDNLNTMREKLANNGVTSVLATTITNSKENLVSALKSIYTASKSDIGTQLIGIHFEGPYIDLEKKGAQPGEFIKSCDISEFDKYNEISHNMIKKISYSPNQDQDFSFIKHLKSKNIIGSLAHSVSNYEQTKEAINNGLTSSTHTLNAMTSFKHDEPGAFGATLESNKVYQEYILDGKHVSFLGIKFINQIKDKSKIVVITDAMRAAGTSLVKTEIGGQKVDIINNGKIAVLEGTSTLAGSVILMKYCFANLINEVGLSINEAVMYTSTNPAQQLNIKKGIIKEGYDADLIILDKNNSIHQTIINEKTY